MGQSWPIESQPIEVLEVLPNGIPRIFTWHGRQSVTRAVIQDWIAEGDWWLEDGAERHQYAVVQTDRAVLTLARFLPDPDEGMTIDVATPDMTEGEGATLVVDSTVAGALPTETERGGPNTPGYASLQGRETPNASLVVALDQRGKPASPAAAWSVVRLAD